MKAKNKVEFITLQIDNIQYNLQSDYQSIVEL